MPIMCVCVFFFLTYHTFLFYKPLPTSDQNHMVRQIWQLQKQYFRKTTHTDPAIQCYCAVYLKSYRWLFSLTNSFNDSFGCELLGYRSPPFMSFFSKHLTSILLIVGTKKWSKIQFPFYIFNLLNNQKNGVIV